MDGNILHSQTFAKKAGSAVDRASNESLFVKLYPGKGLIRIQGVGNVQNDVTGQRWIWKGSPAYTP